MNKLKRVVKIQMFSMLLLPMLIWILIFSIHNIQEFTYKEIPLNDFIEKIVTNRIETVMIKGDRYEIEIDKTGEKYYYILRSDNEKNTLEKGARFDNGYPSYVIKHSADNSSIALSILYLVLIVIILNASIMWLITMFDLLGSDFHHFNNKWIWLVCFILMPLVAPFYYIFIAEKQKIPSANI